MRLFIVHAGYYDSYVGIYELHTNFMVAANDVSNAKKSIKKNPLFIEKKMHIDAIQEIEIVDGYRVNLVREKLECTKLTNYDYSEIKKLA